MHGAIRKTPSELSGWMLGGSTAVGLVGAAVGTCYAALTLRLPQGSYFEFLGLALLLTLVFSVSGHLWTLRSMGTLRSLGRAAAAPSKQLLAQAVREAVLVPDRLLVVGLVNWVAGAAGLGLLLRFFAPDGTWGMAGRVAFLGTCFGFLTTALAHFVVTLRSRVVVRAVAQRGLSPNEVAAAVPMRRWKIRARLVVFTAVTVVVPAVLTADAFAALSEVRIERVRAAPTLAEKRLVAAEEQVAQLAKVALLCGLVLALAVATAYAGGTALSEPMREIADYAGRIAQGQLDTSQVIAAEDELGAVGAAFSTLQAQLLELLSRLRKATLSIGSATEQILATSTRYEAGAASQATALNETSATTEELARNGAQIAENAAHVASMAQRTLTATEEGGRAAEEFSLSIHRMREDNQSIALSVERLSLRVAQIGKIVEVIHQVASRSDLLALSAELEGIKAGELGRGFSLVAAEMRRLAENVLESTREIEELIEEIREATTAAVDAAQNGVSAAEDSSVLAEQVAGSLHTIGGLAKDASEAVQAISLATHQQRQGTDQLALAMSEILRVTEQSTAATRDVGAAHQGLAAVAREIKRVVDRFRVGEAA